MDTVELLLAPPGLEADSSIWAVAIHGTLGVPDSLTPTSDLGVGHQRWDWRWAPSYLAQDTIDRDLMGQRRVYLRTANRIGIDVLIIVGGSLSGDTPTWVTDGNFAQEWNSFCELVGQQFGASAYWYQLANEQNWVWGRWDDATVFNECFDGLETGEVDEHYPLNYDHTWDFRSIVNAATYGPGDWRGDLRDWLASAGPSIDVVAIDHYPGEWPGGPYDEDWSHLEWLGDFAVLHGKLAAVMETGKSTAWPCDQTCQSNWILNNIRDRVRPIVSDHNTYHWNNRFVLLTWYELWDSGAWPLESFFGLMTRTYSPKTSYAAFRSEGLNYVGPPFYS